VITHVLDGMALGVGFAIGGALVPPVARAAQRLWAWLDRPREEWRK
jgi:hypothetical protein